MRKTYTFATRKLDVEDIAKILNLDDPKLTEVFPCEKGEWVQWLIQHIDNPGFFIRGVFEKDKLIGYLVAVNAFVPPINKAITVLYSKTAGMEANHAVLDELIEWSKEKGAISIDFITDNPIGHSVYGFKKKATMMTMEI